MISKTQLEKWYEEGQRKTKPQGINWHHDPLAWMKRREVEGGEVDVMFPAEVFKLSVTCKCNEKHS